MKKIYFNLLLVILVAVSCKPKVDAFKPEAGDQADFSTYLAIGNSITSGFADGALYKSGQEYSFPNIMAQQLKHVGMQGTFKQPYMPNNNGVGIVDGSVMPPVMTTKLTLQYVKDADGNVSMAPMPVANTPQNEMLQELTTNISADGPFNNIGVPGVKAIEMSVSGLGMQNPYFGRFAANPGSDALVDEIAKVKPTFFTLFIGNNDVLGYASSGGTDEELSPIDGVPGVGFKASYEAVLNKLQVEGKWKNGKMQGILATVPDMKALPFFTTVPYNLLVLENEDDVIALNAAYAPYNQLMEGMGLDYRISFQLGPNPIVIADPSMPLPEAYAQYKFRQINADELVLLDIPQDKIKKEGWGSQKPVPDRFTLRASQITEINSTVEAYNAIITDLAAKNNLAIIHPNDFLLKAVKGELVEDGIHYSSKFITGSLFSLDGVHLTPQGNALMANNFIRAINKKYNSSIPTVPVATYPAIQFPE